MREPDVSRPAAGPVRVTILTCTFNRAHTLPRLYESLARQEFRAFEWLVIDDGSTDGTRELVQRWCAGGGDFGIRYFWKANGGKHSAHNFALPLIGGEYCAIIDSDDWYLPTGLATLVGAWEAIPRPEAARFANVEGLAQFPDGKVIGPRFPADVHDSDNYAIVRERPGTDDTRGMYRTAVLREFPFPEGPGYEFVPEALVWFRVARRYRTRFLNQVVGGAEYQPGGLSDRYFDRVLASVSANLLFMREELDLAGGLPLLPRAKLWANYLRLAAHERTLVRRLRTVPQPGLALAVVPLALALFARDRARGHRAGPAAVTPPGERR